MTYHMNSVLVDLIVNKKRDIQNTKAQYDKFTQDFRNMLKKAEEKLVTMEKDIASNADAEDKKLDELHTKVQTYLRG